MKKGLGIAILVCAVALILWYLINRANCTIASGKKPSTSTTLPVHFSQSAPSSAASGGTEDDILEAAKDAAQVREIQQMELEEKRQHNTPIVFYGLVLDQYNQPVAQTDVQYMNADTPDGRWTWKQTSTHEDGRFNINGVRGRYLDIKVQHPGYYNLPESRLDFTYAGSHSGSDFKPNPANPVVFRLRKKGEAAELIHQSDQILFNKEEKERSFSLIDHTRRRDRPEYVIIRPVDNGRINSRGKHVLDLELSVPQGGLQLRTDPFLFTAPDSGYQTTLIAPPGVGVNLVDYFVRFESGNYGRFTIAGNSGQYDVESFLNPDRSPNLEHDIDKEITVVPTGKMGVDLLYPAKKTEPKRP